MLTPFQRASLINGLLAKDQVIDPDTGAPLDWSGLGGVSEADLAAALEGLATDGELDAAIEAALASIVVTQEISQNFVTQEFITQLVTELTTVEEENTYVTQITENNTFVTNVTQQITNQINGKKGQANELASLDATGHLVSAQAPGGSFQLTLDGGGVALTTGVKYDFVVPFNCVLTGWTLLADQSGSIVIDIWKDSYANYPPTVADTIITTSKPTLSGAAKAQDTDIAADWTGEALTAGQTLRFNIDSVATVQRVVLSLAYTRT